MSIHIILDHLQFRFVGPPIRLRRGGGRGRIPFPAAAGDENVRRGQAYSLKLSGHQEARLVILRPSHAVKGWALPAALPQLCPQPPELAGAPAGQASAVASRPRPSRVGRIHTTRRIHAAARIHTAPRNRTAPRIRTAARNHTARQGHEKQQPRQRRHYGRCRTPPPAPAPPPGRPGHAPGASSGPGSRGRAAPGGGAGAEADPRPRPRCRGRTRRSPRPR